MTLKLWRLGNVTMLKIGDETGQSVNVNAISRIFYRPVGTTIELKNGISIEITVKYETVVNTLFGEEIL